MMNDLRTIADADGIHVELSMLLVAVPLAALGEPVPSGRLIAPIWLFLLLAWLCSHNISSCIAQSCIIFPSEPGTSRYKFIFHPGSVYLDHAIARLRIVSYRTLLDSARRLSAQRAQRSTSQQRPQQLPSAGETPRSEPWLLQQGGVTGSGRRVIKPLQT